MSNTVEADMKPVRSGVLEGAGCFLCACRSRGLRCWSAGGSASIHTSLHGGTTAAAGDTREASLHPCVWSRLDM